MGRLNPKDLLCSIFTKINAADTSQNIFYYVYIFQCIKNNSLYIDYSSDLKKRLTEHNSSLSQATKSFIPYKLQINSL